jgi:acyl-coenzyme A synthetase/AMP-(fatty) acid ligase
MTVTGGENAYSAEVENILSIHPAVAAVALIGVPDPRWRAPSKRASSGAKGRQPGKPASLRTAARDWLTTKSRTALML